MTAAPESNRPALSATLPGTWRLLSRIDLTDAGDRSIDPLLGEDPIAVVFYDRAGNFSAQFMKRDRSAAVADAPAGGLNNTRAQGGYDAYFGTYTVDDVQGTVTQYLVGTLSKDNVGQTVTRAMTVEGDTLTIQLRTTAVEGHPVNRTLTWRRVG